MYRQLFFGQVLLQVEQDLLQEEIRIPVYFAEETETLLEILNEIQGSANADEAASAFEGKLKIEIAPESRK